MGEINQIIGDKIPLVISDKVYYLAQFNDKMRAEYERFMETEALKNIQLHKEQLGDDYFELLNRTNQDIVAGVYSFGGKQFIKSTETLTGLIYLLFIMLKPYQKKITLDEVRKLAMDHAQEIALSIRQAMGVSEVENVKKKNLTPNKTESSITP